MIRVTVELLSARTGKRSVIGMMDICNRGNREFGHVRGDYDGRLYRRGKLIVSRVGKVENFPRKSYPIWRLVMRMLAEMFPEERKVKNG